MHRPCATRIATLVGLALLLACSRSAPRANGGPVADWPAWAGDLGGGRHSPLTQITPENVRDLEVAWVHHSGDMEYGGGKTHLPSSLQVTPIVVEDTLFYCTPFDRVFALDPETGAERWAYDPGVDRTGLYLVNCRGVSAWRDAQAPRDATCSLRIFLGTLDARLIALDGATGKPCEDFGRGGAVDLREGVGDAQPGEYGVTSAPLVLGDKVVTGAMVLDNRRTDAPGGVVRAFDARTGALAWAWDPIPPNQVPDSAAAASNGGPHYRRGTTNAWSTLSGDPQLGLVYVPTGNTSPDYYGGQRDGLDYYSSSVVALRADTGEVAWHFQTVHHDVWDYDVPSQPVLFEFPGKDGPVPALAQATKMGHLFLLDRRTGAPLFPVEERPVPQGAVPGETLSPTQPFPTKPPPLHPATLTPDEAYGFTPWDRGACRDAVASLRSDGIFTPPSLQGSVQYPGMAGGSNWGSVSVDPQRGLIVLNQARAAVKIRLVPRDEFEKQFPDGPPTFGYEPQGGTPYALERVPLLSPLGAPCNPPPWGTLTAVDLATGEVAWDVPLGTTRDMAPFPVWVALGTFGVPNQGGAITTASGLTFIGATTDHYLRAFETDSGEEIWRTRLPNGGHATPMTYRLREDGRQFVVIAAGGHGMLERVPGDALMAFALP
ncbi:MAG TPA: pyrroloquinoline quinone-dependent dehydrogenase [Myxococcota bacterium]|nr:pyrroloquinoline quinone-dependent dehydrogenase [Myxococcota bacterium]